MAFCPHCGQRVGDQATRCIACGKNTSGPAPAGAGSRFKGTMMMSAPNVGASPASQAVPQDAVPSAAAPGKATAQTAAVAAAPEQVASLGKAMKPAPGADRRAFGATMVGGMVAPSIPSPDKAKPYAGVASGTAHTLLGAVAAQPSLRPPPKAASAPSEQPAPRFAPAAIAQHAAAPHPTGTPSESPAQAALPGDPMTQPKIPRPAAAAPRLRPSADVSLNIEEADDRSGIMWLGIGFVGMLAIAGVGLLAAKLLGLL